MLTEARAIIFLDTLPAAVDYRRYFHVHAGKTALEYCVRQFATRISCDIEVVVFDQHDHERASDIMLGQPCRVRRSHTPLQLAAILELADSDVLNVVVFRLECLLAPLDLPLRVLERHTQKGNGMTWVEGLPSALSPVVFSKTFLDTFLALGMPPVATSIEAVELVRKAGPANVSAAVGVAAEGVPLEKFCGAARPAAIEVAAQYDTEVLQLLRIAEDAAPPLTTGTAPLARIERWHAMASRGKGVELELLTRRARRPMPSSRPGIPRVLFVSHAAGYSGAEESLVQLVRKLPSERYDKHALVPLEGKLTRSLRDAGVAVVCPGHDFAETSLRNMLYSTAVLREIAPDIVHLNGLDGLPILTAARLAGIPLVLHARIGVFSLFTEYVEAASRTIAVSEFIRCGLQPLVSEPQRLRVIYDEVDEEAFRPGVFGRQDVRRVLNIPGTAFVIGMIARFAPSKRHDILLRSVHEAREHLPHLWLLLVGEPAEHPGVFSAVQTDINRFGLTECVTWVPFVDDIRRILSALDALVLCGDREALGRCVVEAMAMEVPVIVSEGGGTHEIVAQSGSGFVVEPGQPAALADAIVRMSRDLAQPSPYGRAGRDYVLKSLTSAASATAVSSIYQELLANPTSPANVKDDGRLPTDVTETERR